MARKMVDDILHTERQGEKLIDDANIKAREITDGIKAKIHSEKEKSKTAALEKAKSVIDSAKAEALNEKQKAEAEAENLCNELLNRFEKNRKSATEKAISLLCE